MCEFESHRLRQFVMPVPGWYSAQSKTGRTRGSIPTHWLPVSIPDDSRLVNGPAPYIEDDEMTKPDLKHRAEQFIDRQGESRDEWYVSDKQAFHDILAQFLKEEFNIEIDDPVFVTR